MATIPRRLMKHYALTRPATTHSRPATCAEVDCPNHLRGWRTSVDVGTALGQEQARYVTRQSGRRYTMERQGSIITFTFPAGQNCFAAHRVDLEREPFYLVRDGMGRTERTHTTAELWVEDFATHQQGIADRVQRG